MEKLRYVEEKMERNQLVLHSKVKYPFCSARAQKGDRQKSRSFVQLEVLHFSLKKEKSTLYSMHH
jgi:hypothetical protein